MRANPVTTALSIIALAYGGASMMACQRSSKNATPTAQMQTATPPQAVNQPMAVTGCLRAGDASDTFVLTSSETKDGTSPATYMLVARNGVNLRDNVGNHVEVTGVLSTEQQVSTTTPSTAPQNKPTGTSGTPTISTQTQLDMRRLDVSSVNKLGDRCGKK
jgi:hypothetical protein